MGIPLIDSWSFSIDDLMNIRGVNYNATTFKFDNFYEYCTEHLMAGQAAFRKGAKLDVR